jgi:citrate lyase subunit alpha/citrate CoA-transferase
MTTHGGRARAIESGELHIDVAFVAAPSADPHGNLSGAQGPAACGSLGYAMVDAQHADRVAAVTDHLCAHPLCPIDISQEKVDFVVTVSNRSATRRASSPARRDPPPTRRGCKSLRPPPA